MNKNIIFGISGGIIILAIIFGFALNRSPAAQEKMDNKSTDTAMSSVNKMIKPEVKLPAGLPSDIPLYPNAILTDVFELEPGNSVSLTYQIDASKSSPKQVLDYYETELPKLGYKTDQPTINEAAGNYITGGKKGKVEFRAINYLLTADPTKTSINISFSGYGKK
jgi:hypothetical protein